MARDRQAGVSVGPAWVGPIPINWEVVRVKHLSTIYSGGTPDRENKEYWDDGAIPWLNSGEVNQWLITEPSTFISEDGFRQSSAKWIPKNALVMALAGQGKTKGMVAQLAIASTCNQSMAAIVPAEHVHPRFMQWWLHANYETIRNLAGGEQRDGLNLEIVGNIPCPQPSARSQRAIADYLDRETARLDALVAAKERVLGLLAEKRRALITLAVTRGLDPRAPLRDSGIPSLGEIPAHWSVIPLMWLTQPDRPIMYGIVLPGPDVGDGIPVLKGGNVRPSRMNLASLARTTPEIEAPYARARLRTSDLVYSIRGSICDCEVVPSELEGCNITQDVARVAPRSDVNGAWLRYALICTPIRDSLAAGSLGAAVRGINIFDLKRVRIPTPPPREQALLVAHLAKTLNKLDLLAHATERTVALIKERRAALIAAAVTGQIDVEGAA